MRKTGMIITAVALGGAAQAKVDLVTIPTRNTVQLTIYNSADMTLVREQRALTLKEGINSLQFSWENTLIDPTSLEMLPKANADRIEIQDLIYPPRINNVGLWNVKSEISGKSPVEINYLTSGLSWRAFYMGTLSPDEKMLRLQGYVRVENNSGEDYENAQTRLIVGQVHLIDRIAELAQRTPPYGRPEGVPRPITSSRLLKAVMLEQPAPAMEMQSDFFGFAGEAKAIEKEGLSEYFLYTIEGTETIPNRWAKRLPSFDTASVPVKNIYKYEEDRYGTAVRRFLSFTNDAAHALGETPIPGGAMRVYRSTGEEAHLAFEGNSSFQYIPVGEEAELDLGTVQNVIVEPRLMKVATDNYKFRDKGNISGWDEISDYEIEVRNTRSVPVQVEITRNFGTPAWSLDKDGDYGVFEKYDADTVRFTLALPPESSKTFTYHLTTYHGDNLQ